MVSILFSQGLLGGGGTIFRESETVYRGDEALETTHEIANL